MCGPVLHLGIITTLAIGGQQPVMTIQYMYVCAWRAFADIYDCVALLERCWLHKPWELLVVVEMNGWCVITANDGWW